MNVVKLLRNPFTLRLESLFSSLGFLDPFDQPLGAWPFLREFFVLLREFSRLIPHERAYGLGTCERVFCPDNGLRSSVFARVRDDVAPGLFGFLCLGYLAGRKILAQGEELPPGLVASEFFVVRVLLGFDGLNPGLGFETPRLGKFGGLRSVARRRQLGAGLFEPLGGVGNKLRQAFAALGAPSGLTLQFGLLGHRLCKFRLGLRQIRIQVAQRGVFQDCGREFDRRLAQLRFDFLGPVRGPDTVHLELIGLLFPVLLEPELLDSARVELSEFGLPCLIECGLLLGLQRTGFDRFDGHRRRFRCIPLDRLPAGPKGDQDADEDRRDGHRAWPRT